MEERRASPSLADRLSGPRPDLPPSPQPRWPNEECVEEFSARLGRQTLEPSAAASASSSQSQPSLASPAQTRRPPPLGGTYMPASKTQMQIDPMITARVLRMLRRHRPVMPLFPSLTPFIPPPETDHDHADGDHEYQMEMDEEDQGHPASVTRTRGVWQISHPADGASRCQRIVRNVPRMRKRARKKREHQEKQACGPDDAQGTRLAACPEA